MTCNNDERRRVLRLIGGPWHGHTLFKSREVPETFCFQVGRYKGYYDKEGRWVGKNAE